MELKRFYYVFSNKNCCKKIDPYVINVKSLKPLGAGPKKINAIGSANIVIPKKKKKKVLRLFLTISRENNTIYKN